MNLATRILLGMLVGITLGLLLGPSSPLLPQTGVILPPSEHVHDAPGAQGTVAAGRGLRRAQLTASGPRPDATGQVWVEIEWTVTADDAARLGREGVAVVPQSRHTGWVVRDRVRYTSPLGQRLVSATEWVGRLFLAMIKMVVVPLVFFSLVMGVASLGDLRRLGRMGGLMIAYFTATTVLALCVGLAVANVFRPGALIAAEERTALQAAYAGDAHGTTAEVGQIPSLVDQLVGIVPSNPVAALAEGNMLAIIFVAVVLGAALTMMDRDRAAPALRLFDTLNEAMVSIVHMAMWLAPFGVAALLFEAVGSTGVSVLAALAAYCGVVLLGLALHMGLVYAPVVRFLARLPFFGFLTALRDPITLAFSTSSSSATLPVTKETCEKNLGIDEAVTSFVLPVGATVNMDGTALYQGVAAVFIAQAYGMNLSVSAQATIVVSATLASVGAAGVPGAGMVTLAMVLTAVGVPVEGIALVMGVDRLLDMFRTTTNVVGDATATAMVARWQGDAPPRIQHHGERSPE